MTDVKIDDRTSFTIDDVSEKTGISRSTIRQYVREGLVQPRWGWNTEVDHLKKYRRACWIYTIEDATEMMRVRAERRIALSLGLDRYWERARNEKKVGTQDAELV